MEQSKIIDTLETYHIATARNPSHFGLTDKDLGLTEITLCPNPNGTGPTELTYRSHRKS